jgi:tetratricopeptide (TPR) repeat protein
MRGVRVLTCCWPGLSRVWLRGSAASLATSAAFAAGLNVVLWFCFGLANSPPFSWQVTAWLALGALWLAFCWQDYRRFPALCRHEPSPGQDDLFLRAQAEYLKGHWFEAEKLAQSLTEKAPRDVEAHLLLASTYRRMRRIAEARTCLAKLARLDGAEAWSLEMSTEARLFDALGPEQHERPANAATKEEPPESLARAA